MLDTLQKPEEPTADEQSQAPRGRFTIRMDLVMEKTANLPERQRVALRWIASYGHNTNQSHRDIAPKLKQPGGEPYSHDSLYHSLVGNRSADQLGNIVTAIETFRKLIEERSEVVKTGFVENSISRKIWRYCRKALRRQRMGVIIGESQIGKTIALTEYAREHNHGETKYLRMEVGGTFASFLKMMAAKVGVPVSANVEALREAIIGGIDEHMLVIVDEMHEPFGARGNKELGVKIVNFLREVYDRKKCGLVLCGTKVFESALQVGVFARNMVQTLKRGLPILRLPTMLSVKDMAIFARKYGLGPAPKEEIKVNVTYDDDDGEERKASITDSPLKLQTMVMKQEGLGRWLVILEEAADIAREKRSPISWGKVLIAWDSFERDSKFQYASPAEEGA